MHVWVDFLADVRMLCRRKGKVVPKFPDDVVVLDVAYHGHTQSIVDISPYKWRQVRCSRVIGCLLPALAACLLASRVFSSYDLLT